MIASVRLVFGVFVWCGLESCAQGTKIVFLHLHLYPGWHITVPPTYIQFRTEYHYHQLISTCLTAAVFRVLHLEPVKRGNIVTETLNHCFLLNNQQRYLSYRCTEVSALGSCVLFLSSPQNSNPAFSTTRWLRKLDLVTEACNIST